MAVCHAEPRDLSVSSKLSRGFLGMVGILWEVYEDSLMLKDGQTPSKISVTRARLYREE